MSCWRLVWITLSVEHNTNPSTTGAKPGLFPESLPFMRIVQPEKNDEHHRDYVVTCGLCIHCANPIQGWRKRYILSWRWDTSEIPNFGEQNSKIFHQLYPSIFKIWSETIGTWCFRMNKDLDIFVDLRRRSICWNRPWEVCRTFCRRGWCWRPAKL